MQNDDLLFRLDQFIRKYYKNLLVKGALLSFTLLLAAFLFVSVFEYYGRFGTGVRAAFFYGFILLFVFVVAKFIASPLAGLARLGKTISRNQAAIIIGDHFSNVKDKLLNLLQLREMAMGSAENELLLAGIQQKTNELKPVPFVKAIDVSKNKKMLRYAAIPAALFLLVMLLQSSIIIDSTKRLVGYNKEFPREAPFKFVLKNRNLKYAKYEDVKLELETVGDAVPAELYVLVNGQKIKMSAASTGRFNYTLSNVQSDMELQFSAGEFYSDFYSLKVLPKPELLGFEIELTYPEYTGLKNENLTNAGDLTLPAGTKVEWKFDTRDAEQLKLFLGNNPVEHTTSKGSGKFNLVKRFLNSARLGFVAVNKQINNADTTVFSINVVPDRFPVIRVDEKQDSSSDASWFVGTVSDDYGIKRIVFNYRITKSENASSVSPVFKQMAIPVTGKNEQVFSHAINNEMLGLQAGDDAEFYFEVWDNDAVSGSKSTKTEILNRKRDTEKESKTKADKTAQSMKAKMENAMKSAAELQKELNDLQKSLSEQNKLQWQQKEKISEMAQKEKKLIDKIEELKKESKKLQKEQAEFAKPDEELLKKQQELQKKLDEILPPEMKEMLKKLEEMLQKNKTDEVKKQLEQMKQENKDVKKEMESLLEQFKKLELEKKIEEQIKNLEKLAEKEEQLAEKTENKEETKSELKEQQEKINEEFNEIKKEQQEIKKESKELETPMEMESTQQEEQETQQELDNAEESLDKGKNDKASKSQKGAASKMKKMAEKMASSLEEAKKKNNAEDYQKLREILENLVQLSDDQEKLMQDLKTVRNYNPRFVELAQQQIKLKEDAAMIEDSLFALSKRQPKVSSFINKEISKINSNLEQTLGSLKQRQIGEAVSRQQYVMTSLNNLAVMLSEALKNMQQEMNQQSKPGAQCNNPKKQGKGKGKPNLKNMRQMQEGLGKELSELQKMQKEGKTGRKLSEQLAKTAAQQEALRREFEKLQKQLQEQGEGDMARQMNGTKELMEQNEKNLVNKQITPELFERQKEIETRMLEHEKADRTQETEEKREGEASKNYPPATPPNIAEFIKLKQKEQEMFKTLPPELSPFYRKKVEEYFKEIR